MVKRTGTSNNETPETPETGEEETAEETSVTSEPLTASGGTTQTPTAWDNQQSGEGAQQPGQVYGTGIVLPIPFHISNYQQNTITLTCDKHGFDGTYGFFQQAVSIMLGQDLLEKAKQMGVGGKFKWVLMSEEPSTPYNPVEQPAQTLAQGGEIVAGTSLAKPTVNV